MNTEREADFRLPSLMRQNSPAATKRTGRRTPPPGYGRQNSPSVLRQNGPSVTYDCFGTSYLNSNQVYSYFFPTAYIGRNMLHSMITKRTYLPIFSHTTTATLLARRLRIGIGIMLRHKDNRSACTICGQL